MNNINKGLDALQRLYDHNYGEEFYIKAEEDAETVEKALKSLNIIISIFDIKIVGDYLIARRGETCIVYNLKLKQEQELINLLKEVLS